MGRISWQGALVVVALIAAGVLVALFGPLEIATAIWGVAAGLIPRFGAVGGPR